MSPKGPGEVLPESTRVILKVVVVGLVCYI